jgi:hypothetical protein
MFDEFATAWRLLGQLLGVTIHGYVICCVILCETVSPARRGQMRLEKPTRKRNIYRVMYGFVPYFLVFGGEKGDKPVHYSKFVAFSCYKINLPRYPRSRRILCILFTLLLGDRVWSE